MKVAIIYSYLYRKFQSSQSKLLLESIGLYLTLGAHAPQSYNSCVCVRFDYSKQ